MLGGKKEKMSEKLINIILIGVLRVASVICMVLMGHKYMPRRTVLVAKHYPTFCVWFFVHIGCLTYLGVIQIQWSFCHALGDGDNP